MAKTKPAVSPVWNPADTHVNLTLSESNLRFSDNSGTTIARATRALTSKSSGKWFFQGDAVVNSSGGGVQQNTLGIATAAAAINTDIGGDVASYGYAATGVVRNGGTTLTTYATFSAGDRIGVAVDFGANKIWWSKNGVWNGDPVAGTGGVSISAGTYYPAGSANNLGSMRLVATNTPPFGYGLWS